jgi:hypothetical protein
VVYGFLNKSGNLAIFTAILRASSLLSNLAASLITDPRVGGRGECPVHWFLRIVENKPRGRSQHDRCEAGE